MALGWGDELRSLLDFLPLILVSILIALLAAMAGPASTQGLFQSPVSPIGTSPIESPVVSSPAVPQGTAASPTLTARVLTAVPATPNLIPWVIGLLVIVIVVGAILYWRGRREGGEGRA